MKILPTLAIFLLASACSFKKNELANQTQNGHEELYSEPAEAGESKEAGTKKIVIAATNDISGNFGTQAIKIKDSHNKLPLHIEIGGVDFLSSYLKILRSRYSSVVLVDSGDILPSERDEMTMAQDFYSLLKYDAITPGLTDLSLRTAAGVNPVKKFAAGSQVPVLTSNLYELKTALGADWKGTQQYQLKEINGMKVGIIGILADDISSLTPVDNRVGLFLENSLQSTLHQARRLRSLGAQIIVVLTHQGLDCGNVIAEAGKLPITKVNFEPRKEGMCDLSSPLGTYLQRLPAQLVDVVVAGRNHRKVANFINGIAVISGFDGGKSLSRVEFTIDEKSGKVLSDKTVIHQPVMICREFFKETNDCYPEDPSINHKERVPAKFLGIQVERDEEIRNKFKKFFDDSFVVQHRDTEELRHKLNADLVFMPETSGNTHLVVVELTGNELSPWLENAYNEDEASLWSPSPFERKGNSLNLSINGEDLNHSRSYRILTDLESLQRRRSLRKYISNGKLISYTEESWNGSSASDAVTTSAASHRQ